jgi:hypothetical protein
MACSLGPDFLCSSITSLRSTEDTVTALILAAIILLVIDLGYHTIKNGPLLNRLLVLALGFLPFFLWKLSGAYRRIFLDSTSPWYGTLNELGEVLEGISALFILAALVYMYILVKPKKVTS